MAEHFRKGGLVIAPPFIRIGSTSIRVSDVSGVTVRSGSENAMQGCLWTICGLFFAMASLVLGPLGWIAGAIIFVFTLGAAVLAWQGSGGMKTVVVHVGGEDLDVFESKNAQEIFEVKIEIEKVIGP